jgi:hypothetical protein
MFLTTHKSIRHGVSHCQEQSKHFCRTVLSNYLYMCCDKPAGVVGQTLVQALMTPTPGTSNTRYVISMRTRTRTHTHTHT